MRRDLQDVIPKGRTPNEQPARVGIGGAARENVFRSSGRAVSRTEVSRTEAETPSRGESNRGSQRTQNEAPAEKTVDKNQL